MAGCLVCIKLSSKPMLVYCQLDPREQTSVKFNRNSNIFIPENAIENVLLKMETILCLPQFVNHRTPFCRPQCTIKPLNIRRAIKLLITQM